MNESSKESKTRPSGPNAIEVVLFDMGGVLVQLGSLPELLEITIEPAEFWPKWIHSPAVRSFERGDIGPDEFARRLVAEAELSISPAQFLQNFERFPQGLMPGATELVSSVTDSVTVGVLSNTNALHWFGQPDSERLRTMVPIEHHYLSFEIGMLKPDREIFDHIAADLKVAPEAILFLDDNLVNVEGARAAGWTAEVTKTVERSTEILAEFGLVSLG